MDRCRAAIPWNHSSSAHQVRASRSPGEPTIVARRTRHVSDGIRLLYGDRVSGVLGSQDRGGSGFVSQVICWRQFGTCFWTSTGLGRNDDGTPLRCSIRWAARSGTGHGRAGPGRHRGYSRCSVGSPAGPLTPMPGPLASAATVVQSDGQSLPRSRVSGRLGSSLAVKPRSIPVTRKHGKYVTAQHFRDAHSITCQRSSEGCS